MAEAVAFYGAVSAWLATPVVGAITYGTILTAVVMTYTIVESNRRARAAKAAALDSIEDRKVIVRSGSSPHGYVLGETITGGTLIYTKSVTNEKPFLWMVIAVAANPCNALKKLVIGDRSFDLDLNGDIVDNPADDALYDTDYYDQGIKTLSEDFYVDSANYYMTLQYPAYVIRSVLMDNTQANGPGENGDSMVSGTGQTKYSNLAYFHDPVSDPYRVRITTPEVLPTYSGTAAPPPVPAPIFTIPSGDDPGLQITNDPVYNPAVGSNVARVTVTYVGRTGIGPLIRCRFHKGAIDQEADSALVAASDGEWTSEHRGLGHSYVVVRVRPDTNEFPAGLPAMAFIVQGANNIWDPRDGTTLYKTNVALIGLWYLLVICQRPLERIDLPSFIAAANVCDETVPIRPETGQPVTQYETRYTFNGKLDASSDPVDNLKTIASAMAGSFVYFAGKWFAHAGAYTAPVVTLTDDDLADGGVIITPTQSLDQTFNAVRVKHFDKDNMYTWSESSVYESQKYITEDQDRKRYLDVSLYGTVSKTMAARIAKIMLLDVRNSFSVSATYRFAAYSLRPGLRVQQQIERMGTDKPMRVQAVEPAGRGRTKLVLKEDAPEFWAWDYDENSDPDPAPNTTLDDFRIVKPITGVIILSNSSTAGKNPDGTVFGRARISWDKSTDFAVLHGGWIEVQWKQGNETSWRDTIRLDGRSTYTLVPAALGEVLNVQVRAVNSLQIQGPWSTPNAYTVTDAPFDIPSVNLLVNAALNLSTAGWEVVDGNSALQIADGLMLETQYFSGKGIPGVVRIVDTRTNPIAGYILRSSPVSVQPGKRMCFYADVFNVQANVTAYIVFTNVAGNEFQTEAGTTSFLKASGGPVSLADYKRIGGFVTIPAGAVRARVHVTKFGHTTGISSSFSLVSRPFLGNVSNTQVTFPTWDPGSQNPIEVPALVGDVSQEKTTVTAQTYGISSVAAGSPVLTHTHSGIAGWKRIEWVLRGEITSAGPGPVSIGWKGSAFAPSPPAPPQLSALLVAIPAGAVRVPFEVSFITTAADTVNGGGDSVSQPVYMLALSGGTTLTLDTASMRTTVFWK